MIDLSCPWYSIREDSDAASGWMHTETEEERKIILLDVRADRFYELKLGMLRLTGTLPDKLTASIE